MLEHDAKEMLERASLLDVKNTVGYKRLQTCSKYTLKAFNKI